MPNFKRSRLEGGTFFFTLVTNNRQPLLASDEGIGNLRSAFRHLQRERPFTISAVVILPDYLHFMMSSKLIGLAHAMATEDNPPRMMTLRNATANDRTRRKVGNAQPTNWRMMPCHRR